MLAILAFLTLAFAVDISTCTKPYCATCDDTKCTACIADYILDAGECKFKRDLGCESFLPDGDSYKCPTCTDGYKHEGKKCAVGNELCGYFNTVADSYTCTACIGGYILGSTKCNDCTTQNKYCVALDTTADDCTKCKTCAPGTKLNAGICELIDEFCAAEITGDKCTTCVAGYYVGTAKCEKGTIDLCEQYDTATKCTKCFHDSILKDGLCHVDANCAKYGDAITLNENECTLCKVGYGLISGECKQCQADAHCQYCNGDVTKCTSCDTTSEFAILKTEGSKCVACAVNNCAQCVAGDETTCYVCNEKHGKLEAGKKCDQCTATNCEYCNGDLTTCGSCYDNDLIVDKNCVDCTPSNCNECVEGDGSKCNICDTYYAEVDGACQKCSDHCTSCESSTVCITCEADGYRKTTDSKCEACTVSNCATCTNAAETCIKCKTGYTLVGNKCVANILYCTEHLEDGKCKTCDENYAFLNDGKCDAHHCSTKPYGAEKECEGCVDGYFLNNQYKCVACDAKCLKGEDEEVKAADETFYGCVNAAVECEDLDLMRDIDKNCRYYNKDHTCIECALGYNLKDGKCVLGYEECVATGITVTGKCTLCENPTTLEYWPGDDFVCVDASGAFGIAVLAVFAIFMMF